MHTDNNKHIRQVINALRQDKKFKKGLQKAQIKQLWKKLMSDTIDNYTSNITFKNGILTVYLTSSALREELNRKKKKITDLLNRELGSEEIKKVTFK